MASHFQPRRHRLRAREYRATLQSRFQQCNEGTGVKLLGSLMNIPSLWFLFTLFPLFNSPLSPFLQMKLTIP